MKIKFGCIYRQLDNYCGNDQEYGYYIPVCWVDMEEKEHWRMVDTYMINPQTAVKTLADRQKFLLAANKGESSHCIYWGPSYYYYKNYVQLFSDELSDKEWEVVIDLTQCDKIVKKSELHDYENEDVTDKIPLYWEDSYDWDLGPGLNYLKPGKQKSINAIALHLRKKLLDISYLKNLNYDEKEYYEPLKKYINEPKLDPETKRLCVIALKKFEIYKKAMNDLQKEYDNIIKANKTVD